MRFQSNRVNFEKKKSADGSKSMKNTQQAEMPSMQKVEMPSM